MAPLTNPISAILNLVCLRQIDSTTTLVKQVNLSQNALKQGRECCLPRLDHLGRLLSMQ
jgi:hypothetical protein